ncbi:MAG: cysteine desulfurase NifS [Candidatus Ryanbacteria bacterium CG10_big_fil_rev_8_21_14_0_10_43_42]|uniref:Cysteine desulfurase NifS n=1 Tax=Candidatus Ryanbacteria bacterium CG10_big_fil_rev_8_21_14_0_10_43_42 TaxID=1974864 RepID=A0A2M8KX26_9BACT|nr:MAG: cysteine desulfurase NifS [Candidatus Ryanbacteria bacterium CG10_big_fil_rev_8_21_14_0_10_43_42]
MKKRRIYLDYAAATPLNPSTLRSMLPFLKNAYGNPSSIHEEGRIAKKAIMKARADVARILHVHDDEIIFTGSGTESVALAIHGILTLFPKKHIITSTIEHPAALENIRMFEQKNYPVSYVSVSKEGTIHMEDIKKSIRPETVFISIMYANNEIGSVQPIKDIAKIVKNERMRRLNNNETLPVWLHTDACQAAGYLDINILRLHTDLFTLNGSKIYGPKGVGVLYKSREVSFNPFWKGGGQENTLRSGTENVAGIVGIAHALTEIEKNKEKEVRRLSILQDYFIKTITQKIPEARITLSSIEKGGKLPHIVHVMFPNRNGEILAIYLDNEGIAVSSQSACATTTDHPSHVMIGLGRSEKEARESIRFSFGKYTTKKDIDCVLRALSRILVLLEKMPSDTLVK